MNTTNTSTPTLHSTAPSLERTIDKIADTAAQVPLAAERMAERATEVARQGTQQVKAQFNQVTDSAIAYVKDEPVRALLMAAAAGAALMALASLVGHSRR